MRKFLKNLLKNTGRAFLLQILKYFRLFYQKYSDRKPEIRHLASDESSDALNDMLKSVTKKKTPKCFSPSLSWTHYRALSKVENDNERLFYEIEAEKEGWSVPVLEKQIHSFLFARLLKSKNKMGVMKLIKEGNVVTSPVDVIKEPYVLDFLGLKDSQEFHESKLESAIIVHLQEFLLELGKGFAFVARQKRMQSRCGTDGQLCPNV